MRHNIIVKWNDSVEDKAAIKSEVEKLFADAVNVKGVKGVYVIPNCIDRENRYDLAISIEMQKECLEFWDSSEVHHAWKNNYGKYIEKKAIFDFE